MYPHVPSSPTPLLFGQAYTITSSYTVVPHRDAATPVTDPGYAGSSPPGTSGEDLPGTGDAEGMDVTVPPAHVHAAAAATAAIATTAADAADAVVEGHHDTAAPLSSSPGLPYTEDVGGGGESLSASPPTLDVPVDDPAAPIIATAAMPDLGGGAGAEAEESAASGKPGETAEADGDAVENRTVSTPHPHEQQEQPKTNSGHGTGSIDASSSGSGSSSSGGNNNISSGKKPSPDSAIDDDATTEAPTLPFRNSWTHKKKPNGNGNNNDDTLHRSDEGNGGGGSSSSSSSSSNGDREQHQGDHSNGDRSSDDGSGFESFFHPQLLPHDGPSLRVGEILIGKLHSVDGPSAVYCSPVDAAVVFSTAVEGGETDDGFAPVEVISTLIHSDRRKVAKARRVRREIAEEDAERKRAGGEGGAIAKKGKLETVRGWLPFGKNGFRRRRAREHARKHFGEVGLTITDRGVLVS